MKEHNLPNTQILSSAVINANLGDSMLIYLAIVTVAGQLSEQWFLLTCKNETKLYENM